VAVFCRRPLRSRLFLFLALPSLFAFGQTVANCRQTIAVNVRDGQGNFVPELKSSSFLARLHGQPVTVLDVKPAQSPVRVVVMLDASGSMAAPKLKWDTARRLSVEMLASLPANSHVGLMVFARDVITTLDLNHSPSVIVDEIKRLDSPRSLVLPGKRTTALLDSLVLALDLFGTAQAGDAVFIVSDGEENRSREGFDKVKKDLMNRNVRLFFLQLREAEVLLPSMEDQAYRFKSLALASGGDALDEPGLWPWSNSRIEAAVRLIYDEIPHYYQVQLESKAGTLGNAKLELDVIDATGRRIEGSKVAHPQKLAPCDVSQKGQ